MSTYPNGITVEVDGIYVDMPDGVRRNTVALGTSARNADFVARCIRLANPPDPATRQVWRRDADGWWAFMTDEGPGWVFGKTAQQFALTHWHRRNGGKP